MSDMLPYPKPMSNALPLPAETTFLSSAEEETERIAGTLAILLADAAELGPVVLLHGQLGAGKTVFARGFARALGIDEAVASPTFPIAQTYQGSCVLHHLDLYRLDSEAAAAAFGVDEYLGMPGAIALIEWPERLGRLIEGLSVISVELSAPDRDHRRIRMIRGLLSATAR